MTNPSSARDSVESLRQNLETLLRPLADGGVVVTLFVYDSELDEFHLPVGLNLLDRDTFDDPCMRPRTDRVAGRIVKSRVPVVSQAVRDGDPLDGPFARRERIRTACGVPIVEGDDVVGVLFVSRRDDTPVTPGDEQITDVLPRLGSMIARAGLLPTLRRLLPSPSGDNQTLDALAKLIFTVLGVPASVWLLDRATQKLHIHASTSLTSTYVRAASATVGDGGVISQVIQTGRPQVIRDIVHDGRVRYPGAAEAAGWRSMIGYPILVRGRTEGVIELLRFDFLHDVEPILAQLHPLAEMASVIVQNRHAAREAKELATLSRALGAPAHDFEGAMRLIVQSARALTAATSSVIYLARRDEPGFSVGARSGEGPGLDLPPRSFGGLTREIVETGTPTKIDDTADPAMRGKLRRTVPGDGIGSLVGVRLALEDDRIGVLYVNASQPHHFDDHDVEMLETLAGQASFALGWARLLLRDWVEVAEATANLTTLEQRAREFCGAVRDEFGFDFAAIQWVRQEERVIETLCDAGRAASLAGRSKHPLVDDPSLRDIHADIVETQHTEVIAGRDPRFDRWTFETYGHASLVRVFAPILLVRGADGVRIENWAGLVAWREPSHEQTAEGRRLVIAFDVPPGCAPMQIDVLGTVEGGFDDGTRPIDAEQAGRLVRFASGWAEILFETTVRRALERIVGRARSMIKADAATLVLGPGADGWIHRVAAGDDGHALLLAHPPQMLVSEADGGRYRRPEVVPDLARGERDDDLRTRYPALWCAGVRALAMFPLAGRSPGVLSLCFRRPHRFTEDEISRVQLLAERATEAVDGVTRYGEARHLAQQLFALHDIAQSLVLPPPREQLLGHIAWNVLNLTAADVVTIYEYARAEMLVPPEIAGHLRSPARMQTPVSAGDAPVRVIRHGEAVYAEDAGRDGVLGSRYRRAKRDGPSFVQREAIVSAGALPLRVGDEILGVIFINYRRRHRFPDAERRLFETLASSAAIALKNRRLVDTLAVVDLSAPDLPSLLREIVRRAAAAAGADRAAIWRYDAIDGQLLRQQSHDGADGEPPWPTGDALPAEVCERRSLVVEEALPRRGAAAQLGRRSSAIWVPIGHPGERPLGWLSVHTTRPTGLHPSVQYALTALARHASLAIDDAAREQRTIAAEASAMVGDLAGPLLHWMVPIVGAIYKTARDAAGDGSLRAATDALASIADMAARLDSEGRRLFGFAEERSHVVDVVTAVARALALNAHVGDRPGDVEWVVDVPADLAVQGGDEAPLVSLLQILIDNALHAMPDGGRLAIHAELEAGGRRVRIVVADTGVGVPEALRDEIFRPGRSFWAQSQSASPQSQTVFAGRLGFGLWWARAYVQRFGGTLTVESSTGKGSRFAVMLPAAERGPHAEEGPDARPHALSHPADGSPRGMAPDPAERARARGGEGARQRGGPARRQRG